MSSVNKKSLRQEFDQLKGKFKDLSDKGKVTPEVDTLFHAMIMLFELLIAIFMERKPGRIVVTQVSPPPKPAKIRLLPDPKQTVRVVSQPT